MTEKPKIKVIYKVGLPLFPIFVQFKSLIKLGDYIALDNYLVIKDLKSHT